MFINLKSTTELEIELINNAAFTKIIPILSNWTEFKKNSIRIIICRESDAIEDAVINRRYSVAFNVFNNKPEWVANTFFSLEKSITEILINKETKLLMFPLSRVCFYYGD